MATHSRSSRATISNSMDPLQGKNTVAALTITSTAGVPPGECRLAKTTACLPIVYGSVALYLGKKADENSTHQWTLYLRGNNNEDLSHCIQKVIFQLHPSFAIPIRELTAPPYEVTERGWGEFEAQIRIIWKDETEKSTVVSHGIKLYPPGAAGNIVTADPGVPVVAESYDEVVFTDPTENFYRQLQRLATAPSITTYSQQDFFTTFSDGDDFQALLEAQKFLHNELATLKERARIVEVELQQADQEYRAAQERSKATTTTTATTAASTSTGVEGATTTATAASTKNAGGATASTTTTSSTKTTTAAAARKSKANTAAAAAAAAAAARGAPASKKAKTA